MQGHKKTDFLKLIMMKKKNVKKKERERHLPGY
jgi:hypothetical protein